LYKKNKILAIIPARSGSKGVKNKNAKIFNSKPLIEWSIREAKKTSLIDNIVISTDSHAIIKIANKLKVNYVKRPKKLSSDNSKVQDAVIHVLNKLKKNQNIFYDYMLLLEPTSPLRSVKTIIKCVKFIVENNINSIIPISEINVNFGYKKKNNFVALNKPARQRQLREKVFFESSTIYAVKMNFFNKYKQFVNKNSIPFIISKDEAFDINDKIDFKISELFHKNQNRE
jgi:CMP-N,N'-diacetyllegionaminic acid synthase